MKKKKKKRRGGDGKDGAPRKKRPASGDREERSSQERGGPLELLKSLGIALVLFLILRSFIIQTFVITSGSMEDTLLVGDFLMVNRAALGSPVPFTDLRIPGYSEPRRLDVIVFDPRHEVDQPLVKRLVGMPGDTLEMRDRTLYLNGKALDEPYVKHHDYRDDSDPIMLWQREHLVDTVDAAEYRPTRDTWGPIVIPEGRYFMLGDNRETSYDSRYWGLLERWRLQGRAVFIYFSYDRDSLKPFPPLTAMRPGRIGDVIR